MNSLTIVQGDCHDYPLNTYLDGGNKAKASYPNGSLDELTGYVFWGRSTTAIFQPIVSWYTAPGLNGIATQTGYLEGEVLVSISNAQGAMLTPGSKFSLLVTWTPAAVPSKTKDIVRIQLIVEPPQIY